MKKKWYILFICLVAFVIAPYVRVEFLTLCYGDKFSNLYDASGWIEDISYFKVMKYREEEADVLYAAWSEEQQCIMGMFIYHFKRESGIWELERWECKWAKYGTAEEFYWPYYPH